MSEMKKIGILSLYYGSLNYGGTLQAYALCRYLEKNGFDARQIAYDSAKNEAGLGKNMHRLFARMTDPDTPFLPQCKKYISMAGCAAEARLFFKNGFQARRAAFGQFRDQLIPSSGSACTDETIAECCENFDGFVVGSDIVWNPYLTDSDTFFLSFAPKEKPKVAYAASLGIASLPPSQWQNYRRRLQYPDALSTREYGAAETLAHLTKKPIETVLDPTLLLSADDYADAAAPRQIEGDYIFCYLLGGLETERCTAKKLAEALHLPLVTIPSPGGEYHRRDEAFGDIRLPDAGPSAFLSLIQNAAYVITDSFHAVAFSVIYHKRFLALKRHADTDPMSLNSRLTDILTALGMPNRAISPTSDGCDVTLLTDEIDYTETEQRLAVRREQSAGFLLTALGAKASCDTNGNGKENGQTV